jgi:copper chaperone CopZ
VTVSETYLVTGMTCGHCVQAVTDELSRLPGVREVRVDLGTGEVTVASEARLGTGDVRGAIDEAGYQLVAPGD